MPTHERVKELLEEHPALAENIRRAHHRDEDEVLKWMESFRFRGDRFICPAVLLEADKVDEVQEWLDEEFGV